MARDNFSKSVIENLRSRVAHRCSNPDCRVPTSAPASNGKSKNIGIAAHICAASEGGPRFDSSMTTTERKSVQNGIWLCANCSIKIDRDEVKYTVGLLMEWKQKAEDTASLELGKKLPSNADAINAVSTALTGYPKKYLASAIENVHKGSCKSLELLDPRFSVESEYSNGKTIISLSARESVQISMVVNSCFKKEYMEKYSDFLEHGKDFEVNSEAVTFDGSRLISEIFNNQDGVFGLLGEKIKAVQKIWLVDQETNLVESFDDIQGEVFFGTKTFTFNGLSFGGLFGFSCTVPMDDIAATADTKMFLHFDKWDMLGLGRLPYFEKLLSLFGKMSQGWEVFISLEIDGVKAFSSSGQRINGCDYLDRVNNLLHYLSCCRAISRFLNCDVKYRSKFQFSSEDHEVAANAANIINGAFVCGEADIESNVIFDLEVGDGCENIRTIVGLKDSACFKLSETVGQRMNLFGLLVDLPVRVFTFDSVLPIVHGDIDTLKSGDIVKVELLPQSGFRYIAIYDTSESQDDRGKLKIISSTFLQGEVKTD